MCVTLSAWIGTVATVSGGPNSVKGTGVGAPGFEEEGIAHPPSISNGNVEDATLVSVRRCKSTVNGTRGRKR